MFPVCFAFGTGEAVVENSVPDTLTKRRSDMPLLFASDKVVKVLTDHLRRSDLTFSTPLLERRLEKILGQEEDGVSACPVRGLRRTWIVTAYRGELRRDYLLAGRDHKIRVTAFGEVWGNSLNGWDSLEYRRGGCYVVGLVTIHEGNSPHPAAVVYRSVSPSGWKKLYSPESDVEGQIHFASRDSLAHLICLSRYYNLKALSQPHAGPLLTHQEVWKISPGRISTWAATSCPGTHSLHSTI